MKAPNNHATTVAETNTPTTHTDGLSARLAELQAMRETIPYFRTPTPGATARAANAASVPREFIELTMSMLDHDDLLVQVKADAAALHDRLEFANSYGPLADEFELMAQALRHSMTVARSEAGEIALDVYAVAKRAARRPQSGDLYARVADLTRALGVRRRLAKAKLAAAKQEAEVEKARAEGIAHTPAVTSPKQ